MQTGCANEFWLSKIIRWVVLTDLGMMLLRCLGGSDSSSIWAPRDASSPVLGFSLKILYIKRIKRAPN
jgi:hypothetical protein